MPFVIDASVVLAFYFEDELSGYADGVLGRLESDSALAPAVWPLEIANGLLIAERRGRLSAADSGRVTSLVRLLPIRPEAVSSAVALGAVLDLARSQNLTAYDASYLELAMREGLPLASQDERLRAAAERVGVPIAE